MLESIRIRAFRDLRAVKLEEAEHNKVKVWVYQREDLVQLILDYYKSGYTAGRKFKK